MAKIVPPPDDDNTDNEEGKVAESTFEVREDEVADLTSDKEGFQLTVGDLIDTLTGEIDSDWPVFVSRDGQIAEIRKVIDKTGQADEHKRQVWLAIGPWKPAP